MKKDIHPQYHKDALVKCGCGNEFRVGSTQKEIEVETCSACHPFYTGQEGVAARGGRVERFQQRAARQQEIGEKQRSRKEKRAQKDAARAK